MSQKDFSVDILDSFIESHLKDIHTILPGRVETYNESQRKAKVKPLIKIKTELETNLEIPPIDNVPVIFPSGKNFTMEWPLEKKDGCLILFSEEGIGNYLNGINVDANSDSYARFSLTDAICIPGLYSFKNIPNSKATIKIDKSGNININNGVNGAAREFDSITIDAVSDPAFFIYLAGLTPPYPGDPITGRISGSSSKVKIG